MSLNDAAERPAAPADRDPTSHHPDDAERRAALAKLGALAAWTAPVMLTLVTSARAQDFNSPPRLYSVRSSSAAACRPGV